MIIQPTFEVQEDTVAKLSAGLLKITGGVIRKLDGTIYEHLKDGMIPMDAAKEAVQEVKDIAGKAVDTVENKNVLFGIGIVISISAAVVGTGILVYNLVKKSKTHNKKFQVPDENNVLDGFNDYMVRYMNSINTQTLTLDIIEELIWHLDQIKENHHNNNVVIEISPESLMALLTIVKDYTNKLSKLNSYRELNASEVKDPFTNLQHYLNYQKQIFTENLVA